MTTTRAYTGIFEPSRPGSAIDEAALEAAVKQILNRRPAVGLGLGVVRQGRLDFFRGHGFADIRSRRPISEDTVFRVGSITKTFTAVAMMQLWERALVDLDALRDGGVAVVAVTHLYDLALDLYKHRTSATVFLRAQRRDDGRRTFKVLPGGPLPTSFGADLYRRIFDSDP
jgi:hypothetical protein